MMNINENGTQGNKTVRQIVNKMKKINKYINCLHKCVNDYFISLSLPLKPSGHREQNTWFETMPYSQLQTREDI